jgi:hypothetical protein
VLLLLAVASALAGCLWLTQPLSVIKHCRKILISFYYSCTASCFAAFTRQHRLRLMSSVYGKRSSVAPPKSSLQ